MERHLGKIAFGLLTVAVMALAPSVCHALTYKATMAETWGITLPDGDPTPLPPATLVGMGVSVPLTTWCSWYTEAGSMVPRAIFHPTARIGTGPTFRLSESILLGVSGLYQYSPAYKGGESHHLIGASLVPTVPISKEISLSLVLGAGKTLDGLWSVSITPKIIFGLPF